MHRVSSPELTPRQAQKVIDEPILVELSLFFDTGSVLIIQRDSGKLLNITDPDQEIQGITHSDHEMRGINRTLLNGIVSTLDEKAYLVTTGYNRHMVRFTQD